MTSPHLWQGHWLNDAALATRLQDLAGWLTTELARPAEVEAVLHAAAELAQDLQDKGAIYAELQGVLGSRLPEPEIGPTLAELAGVLSRPHLERKLKAELGSLHPMRPTRCAYDQHLFEAWAPLGLLVHIAPGNSVSSGFLSLLEGLLTGNLNVLKTGGDDGLFAQHCVKALGDLDPSGEVRRRAVVLRLSSRRQDLLQPLFAAADGVAAWGGEEALQALRTQVPSSARLIEWGHKISLIYIAAGSSRGPELFDRMARECCELEQQACSSPQCLYVETADYGELQLFADQLAVALAKVSPQVARTFPDDQSAAELSLVTSLHRLAGLAAEVDANAAKAAVTAASDGSWRILLDERPGLIGSPLFRTIWLKPLPRQQLLATLRPMRQYLQTAGLACQLAEVEELTGLLVSAGVDRVRQVGQMLGGYPGEPHDGVYALQRYCRRISLELPAEARGVSSFAELRRMPAPVWAAQPVVTAKSDFHDLPLAGHPPQLYFKSGGSSGKPKLSTYSYTQYDEHMRLGAEGLYAAGFDPLTDRAMNAFFAGGLYGGFVSFFSALERLQAVQLPMAAHADLDLVASIIVAQRVNVLLAMPSYLMTLFDHAKDVLSAYQGVTKIYFGGEHFSAAQRRYLQQTFGVQIIRSAAYGSVDIGPLGYQCEFCTSGVHHVQQQMQYLEILALDSDRPVVGDEAGRLIYSPRALDSNKPRRYEIGDVGHWVQPGSLCPCGRLAPRFKLLGRTGDIVRIGGVFLNYQKFAKILAENLAYASEFQLLLTEVARKECLTLVLVAGTVVDTEAVAALCLTHDPDLNEAVSLDRSLLFHVETKALASLERTTGSGKLLRVIDRRVR